VDGILSIPEMSMTDFARPPPEPHPPHRSRDLAAAARSRTRYEINKKAFQSAQAHRSRVTAQLRSQVEETEAKARAAANARRLKKLADSPPDPLFHDRHIIERVVASRNQLYRIASRVVPNGAIPDLESLHALPKDSIAPTRDQPRVFFWG
jgi:hypothetical protein